MLSSSIEINCGTSSGYVGQNRIAFVYGVHKLTDTQFGLGYQLYAKESPYTNNTRIYRKVVGEFPACVGCVIHGHYHKRLIVNLTTTDMYPSLRWGQTHIKLIPCEPPKQTHDLVICSGPLYAHPDPDMSAQYTSQIISWMNNIYAHAASASVKIILFPNDNEIIPRLLEHPNWNASRDVKVNMMSYNFYNQYHAAKPVHSTSVASAVHHYLIQDEIQNHCYFTYGKHTEWMSFIDTDEFYTGMNFATLFRKNSHEDALPLCMCWHPMQRFSQHNHKYMLHSAKTYDRPLIHAWIHHPVLETNKETLKMKGACDTLKNLECTRMAMKNVSFQYAYIDHIRFWK